MSEGPGKLQFGDFAFDQARQLLKGPRGPIALRRKNSDLLLHLLLHADRVVGKGELLAAVWPDVTVSDESLTQCISQLRHALGDADGTIIKTIPRRGYRLDVPFTNLQHRRPSSSHPAVPLALPDRPSLVVLPFANMSDDPGQDYFADGMVEEITTALARVRSLFVIARNSAFAYKGKSPDIRLVGHELGVRYVLEGSVRKSGNRVRITGQLVEAQTGSHIWADRFDGTLGDVFALQDQVTASVVAAISPALRNAEIERARRTPVNDPRAYDLWLRSIPLQRGDTRAGIEEACGLLRQAIGIEPHLAQGYAQLARVQIGRAHV
jgi:TolB-like protein